MVASNWPSSPSSDDPGWAKDTCTTGSVDDTNQTSRAEALVQLMRDALAEFDAVEREIEKGLTAEGAQVTEIAMAGDALAVHRVSDSTVRVETSDRSAAKATRRNRGRRRKWFAAQAAAVDALCADCPSADVVV